MPLVVPGQVDGVVVRSHDDGRIEIVEAPPLAEFSMELLAQADPRVLRVDEAGYLDLAGQAVYAPLRFSHANLAVAMTLICRRVR